MAGDSKGAALAVRYKSAVFGFLARRLPDHAEAEDLTQEVFIRLARRAELSSIDNIERYIFQVATNLLRDRARALRRRPCIDHEGFADPAERLVDELSPERLLLGREAYAAFVRALQSLPDRTRTIFILSRFEGMTGPTIAAELGVSLRLVEKEINRALTLLREHTS